MGRDLPLSTPQAPLRWSRAHQRRLREVWRSAGWPFQDLLEAELLAGGLLERRLDADGREWLRVSDAGVAELTRGLHHNRAARNAHETLVERVAELQARAGRLVWRALTLRAPLPNSEGEGTRWVQAMPDVFSIRPSTVEDYVEPVVHEIKVRRADLLADLARPDKGEAYRALASRCWYVFPKGLARADEVPAAFGVMVIDGAAFEVLRDAPARECRLSLGTWMALARRGAEGVSVDEAQAQLGGDAEACR